MAVLLSVGGAFTVSAQSDSLDITSASNAQLQQLILRLQAQIKAISANRGLNSQVVDSVSPVALSTEDRLQFKSELRNGTQNDDVVKLQKFLATDKSIYPEGLTTGFFGQKTSEAIKRLQNKFQIEATGELNPVTRELINKILLSQGVGREIPPGLLLAPGLRDRIKVKLENINGKFEYRIEDNGNSTSNTLSRFKIEVETKSHNRSKVKVEGRNDFSRAKRVFMIDSIDKTVVIKAIADKLGISVAEVKSVARFDSDDEDTLEDESGDDSNDDSNDDGDDDDSGDDHGGNDDDADDN